MKSLQEIKDDVAKDYGYDCWETMLDTRTKYVVDSIFDDVIRLSNIEVATASLAKAAENSRLEYDIWGDAAVVQKSITSPDNIVTL